MGFDHFREFVKVHTLEHPFPLMIQLTDIVLMGIIMIGIIGYGIDILMRKTENWLVPWKGKI